jgi:hypothetical protein
MSGREGSNSSLSSMSSRILVVGATGKQGSAVLRSLRALPNPKASMAAVVAPQEVPKRRVGVPSDDDAEMTSARCARDSPSLSHLTAPTPSRTSHFSWDQVTDDPRPSGYRKASMAAVVAPQEVPKRRVGVPSDDDAEMTSARFSLSSNSADTVPNITFQLGSGNR